MEDGDCRRDFSLVEAKTLTPESFKTAVEGVFSGLIERTHFLMASEKVSGVPTTAVDKSVETLIKLIGVLKNEDSIMIMAKGKASSGLLNKLMGDTHGG